MNPEVSIDRILTLQSCFIAVGPDSEPGLHQSISWIPAGECGQSTSPQSVRTAGFVLPAIGLRSNKTVTWHPIPDVLHQAHTLLCRDWRRSSTALPTTAISIHRDRCATADQGREGLGAAGGFYPSRVDCRDEVFQTRARK